MAVRLDLKLAIVRSGRTQRALAESAGIPDVKLSKIVCGLVCPSSTERASLKAQLGQDFFEDIDLAKASDGRSARR